MAPAEGTTVGMVGSEVVFANASVLDLLQKHFQHLSSSADQLLFEPDSVKKGDIFGLSQYANVVNNLCKTDGAHSVSVVWIAASFLFCQKLFRAGVSVDADLDMSCPNILDRSLLSKHCSGGNEPVRACTRSLCVADVQLVCEEAMKLLIPANLYTAYTGLICLLAKEVLTASFTTVAVQAMLAIASVGTAAFIKVGASSSELNFKDPGYDGLEFPKEDTSDDLMYSLTNPLYGHHPLVVVNRATAGNATNSKTGEIDWPKTMKLNYEGNLIWLLDWDVAGRDDNLPAHFAAMVAPVDTSSEATAETVDATIIREKNRIGCLVTRWDTATENVLIMGKEQKRLERHSGWLCQQSDMLREITVATSSYFQFGFWPASEWTNVRDIWWDVAAYIGSMTRGWMLDHDTEADIGEHNGMNWVCKHCAVRILERAVAVETALPSRTVRHQRLAWGPQPYFFYSRRHSGLARRVYSAKFFARPGIPWGVVECTSFDHPIAAPVNNLEAMIMHLLNLTGFTVDDAGLKRIAAAMPAIGTPASLGVCEKCEFPGMGLELMMYGHGSMVIAALVKEPARRRFVWEMEGYGGRAFPALFSRLLSGCGCTAYWIERGIQLGYGWGFGGCGSDSCCTDEKRPVPPLPAPIEESPRAWMERVRVKANLQCLMQACKVEFESMDSIKRQIEAGLLQDGWSTLSCIDEVRAMLGMEPIHSQ